MHKTSWITVLGVKPNATGNAWNRRDKKGEEITQEEVQVLVMKGDVLTTQLSGPQRITGAECHSTPSV